MRAAGSLLRRIAIAGQRASLVVARRSAAAPAGDLARARLARLAGARRGGRPPGRHADRSRRALAESARARRGSRLDRDPAAERRPRRGGAAARRGPPRRRRRVGRRRRPGERRRQGRTGGARPTSSSPGLGVPVCRVRPATACASVLSRSRTREATHACARAWPDGPCSPWRCTLALCAVVAWHVESLRTPGVGRDSSRCGARARADARRPNLRRARLVDRRGPRRDRGDRGRDRDLAAARATRSATSTGSGRSCTTASTAGST